MRFVLDKDEEMLKTIQISAKLAKGEKLLRYFKDKAVAGIDGADWWFYYGLLCWKLMDETRQTQKKHEYLVAALEGLDSACRAATAHWPAMFLRSTLVTMLSGDDVDEMCAYLLPTDYTVDDAVAEREAMIAMQATVKAEPYFFIPYAATALKQIETGDTEAALKTVDEGLTRSPAGKVSSLQSLLLIPVIMLYKKLDELGLEAPKVRVKERFNALFPSRALR